MRPKLTIIEAIIALNIFLNGKSINKFTKLFKRTVELIFKLRETRHIPLISHVYKCLISYFTDSIYLAENIETVLKKVFSANKSILNFLYATATRIKIGLPIIIV